MATPGAGGKSTFLPNFTPLSTPMGSRVWSNEASPASGSGSRESLPLFVPPASPTKGGYFGNAVAVGKAGADLTTSTSSTTSTATVVPASSTPAPATATTTTTSVAVNGKGKAKASTFFTAASMYEDLAEVEEQKKLALSFAQKSSVVKRAFGRWVQKAVERAKWMEAVRQGDEYRERMRREGLGRSLGASRSQSGSRNGRNEVGGLRASRFGTPSEKKRRISDGAANGHGEDKMDISELELSTNRRKRARKRMSTDYKRRQTDEELAKRFRENHEEHELRWAHGSFLKVIRDHVRSTPLNTSTSFMHSLSSSTSLSLSLMSSRSGPTDNTSHQHWNVWLSLNPESDATAIWMERKFGMPESGEWASESVFSIPLLPESKNGYPGLIVFENTPLGDVPDPLEKKYRVLDDCTRLREVINALSPRRHFIPSLLVVCWAEQEMDVVYKDFFDMLNKLVSDSTILSYQILPMTSSTNDLDNKLQTALSSMKLDVEGKLVKSLTMKGAFKVLEPAFITFVNEWTENCQFGPRVNWGLYGQVVHAAISILNVMSQLASFLLDVTEGIEQPQDPLPEFDYSQVDDSDSAYDDILDWLSVLDSRDDAMLIATDIQSHRNIGQDFPIRIFLEHLYEITQIRFERRNPTTTTSPRTVLTSNIKEAGDAFKEEIQPHQMKLLQVYNYSVRRSPKRRSYSITTSEQNSPEAKRPRLSDSVSSSQNSGLSSYLNGDADERTPSPTGTNVSLGTETSSGPTVTVAMLRALTKDLKKKYVRT